MTPCNFLNRDTVSEDLAAFIFAVLRVYFSLTVNVADSSESSVFIYRPTGLHISVDVNIDSTTAKISNFTNLIYFMFFFDRASLISIGEEENQRDATITVY
jgi:hypothetical protein